MPSLDSSLSGMLMQTSGPVRAVLVLLLLCSVLCWAIIFEKATRLLRLRRQTVAFERFARMPGVACGPAMGPGLAAVLATVAAAEDQRPAGDETTPARRDRIERALRETLAAELLPVEARLPVLATIGSVAPFIGLFGTVWGIMHAFEGLAQASDTSLAAVAPGIAEALSTTAIGLAAAIPASIAYNTLAAGLALSVRRLSLAVAALSRRMADASAGARP